MRAAWKKTAVRTKRESSREGGEVQKKKNGEEKGRNIAVQRRLKGKNDQSEREGKRTNALRRRKRIETKRRVARDKRRREESSFSTPGQVHASILASFGRECFVQAGIKSRHSFAPLLSRPRTGSLLLASSAPSLARAKDGGKRVAIRDGT